jgi:two-component system nitrogen regulation sensor histidine kinase NtrY
MALRERFRRHHRDSRWIVGALAALLVVFTAIFYLLQRSRDLPDDLIRNRILVFVLLYANVVLILAVLFVLFRNLFKLLVERHNRILGSRFKIKLVATYIGLSLLPVLLLFIYGSQLLHGWIDRWFNEPAVKQVLEQGYAVSQAINTRVESDHAIYSALVAREIEGIDLSSARQRPQLTRRLQGLLNDFDLDYLAVHEGTEFVHAVMSPSTGLGELPDTGRNFLNQSLENGSAVRVLTPAGGQGRLILTATAATEGGNDRPVVVVGTLLDPILAGQTENLIQAYQGYRQLEVQKSDIETSYRLTFLLVTLVILFVVIWVGLYLARRITVPIQALAEGTRRVSDGDLEHRVTVAADDELGVLVESFNRMTAELKRSEEDLLATNRHLAAERALIAAILENLGAGVVAVDGDGRILNCNRAALNMLRQSKHEVQGRRIQQAWSDSQRGKLVPLFEEPPGSWGRATREVRMVLEGDWKTFEAKVKSMVDEDGQPTGKVMVIEDLTDLIKAQQLATWNEAARRIAHEIKNPLTPIKLSAERIRRRYDGADPKFAATLEEATELIIREVESMKSMADEFSRFARMPSPQPAQVDLGRLIAETVHLYAGIKPGVEVSSEIRPGAETAMLDGEQIKRVLINLLDNAIEATPAPGEVRVVAERTTANLRLLVADTGDGIPAEARERLFLPYFSTKGRGTGLGLAIVHRIVTDHFGTVLVEDNEPRGTVFVIELPVQ